MTQALTSIGSPLRVGIVGLNAERGWATVAHIPALRALTDDFELAGVANTSLATDIGAGIAWGNDVPPEFADAMDSKNGVTPLSVNGAHAISAVQSVLGRIESRRGAVSQRRRTARMIETGEIIPKKDAGPVGAGCRARVWRASSFQLRGGLPRGTRLQWEINGTEGDLRITAEAEQMPVTNMSPLRVEGGRVGEDGLRELKIRSSFYFGLEDALAARNVAGVCRLMAQDLRRGTRTAPSFDDAVANRRVRQNPRKGAGWLQHRRRSPGSHLFNATNVY